MQTYDLINFHFDSTRFAWHVHDQTQQDKEKCFGWWEHSRLFTYTSNNESSISFTTGRQFWVPDIVCEGGGSCFFLLSLLNSHSCNKSTSSGLVQPSWRWLLWRSVEIHHRIKNSLGDGSAAERCHTAYLTCTCAITNWPQQIWWWGQRCGKHAHYFFSHELKIIVQWREKPDPQTTIEGTHFKDFVLLAIIQRPQ